MAAVLALRALPLSNVVSSPVNLKNGPVQHADRPQRAQSIPEKFHYVHIDVAEDGHKLEFVHGSILAAFAQLISRTAGTEGGGEEDLDFEGNLAAHATFGMSEAVLAAHRKIAIIIGSARWSAETRYQLGPDAAKAAETAINRGTDLTLANDGALTIATAHTEERGDYNRFEAAALYFEPLTEDEEAFSFEIMRAAMGAFPITGVELCTSGHHYLSGTNKAAKAVMRQVLATMTEEGKAIWGSSDELHMDALFHKSFHVFQSDLMVSAACDPSLPGKLMTMDLGSAAVRLPYKEDGMKGAASFIAVVLAVQSFCARSGDKIEVDNLTAMVAFIDGAGEGAVAAVDPYPAFDDRRSAVEALIVPEMTRVTSRVCVAAGILHAICEASGINTRTESKLAGYKMKKAMSENAGDVSQGAGMHRNFVRFERKAIEDGEYVPSTFTD